LKEMRPVKELVSVIIPVFNRMDWVGEAVDSVLSQTHSSVEILLCDDGSDSDCAEALDRLGAKEPERIQVLHLSHQGAGPARQAGLETARGEFVQYLDSDDRLHPEKFTTQITALRKNPDCGIAYGRTRLIDQDGMVIEKSYKQIQDREFLFPGLLVERWWCTHTPLYRRAVCDRLGPWSDLQYSQDWEYDARAGALKTKLVFVDQVVSDHRHHQSTIRQTGQGRWLDPAGRLSFFNSLFSCAEKAGVPLDVPEMRHFVRWVFSSARIAGKSGDRSSAESLLNLARKASAGSAWGMVLLGAVCRLFGWKIPGALEDAMRRLTGRKNGSRTLRKSWMTGQEHE